MLLFCRSCGNKLRNPKARFCPACGYRLSSTDSPGDGDQKQPRLVIRLSGQPPRELLLDRPVFTIGRKPENDVVLPFQYISGYHGRLEQREGVWHYVDLDSTNGTFVNGRRVPSVALRDGDILRIGDPQGNSVSLTFHAVGTMGALPPVPGTLRIGTTTLGRKPTLIIGRDRQADIHLPAPVVSWHHARLDLTPLGHVLTDLNSTNGTFVNGQRVHQPYSLDQNDVVQIGPFKLVYEASGFQQYTATGGIRLDGVRLVQEVRRGDKRKHILKGVDLSIYPREFVALVGASGAGKSTLLMALSGFARAQGQVMVNGDDLYQHFDLYRALVGYVPQDDIIHKQLTVASALRYAARLRLPADTSAQEIERRIDKILKQVEMTGQKNQIISSLSGGQRKRVSIAVELLAEPRLFFLDEPTSGLDPGLEKKMMHTLRHLADGGQTVVLVTHATANIAQCDHVGFLSQGRLVYFGPPQEALDFFGVTSGEFADIYTKLDDPAPKTARTEAAMWEQRFRRSPQYRQYVIDRRRQLPQSYQKDALAAAQRCPRANSIQQFLVLTRRYLDLVFRDKLLLTVLGAIMPTIGILLLLISGSNWLIGDTKRQIEEQLAADLAAGKSIAAYAVVGNTQRLLFMMALAAILLGLFAAAYEIIKERSIYRRERMVTLRLFPYLASKVVILGAFSLLQCLLLLLVISLKVRMPYQGVIFPAAVEMYVTLILGTLAAIMVGLFISALVSNTNTVIYVVLLFLFFQIVFAGVIFDLPGVARGLSKLTLSRWAMEGLGASANLEHLNSLTRTRFQPDPITIPNIAGSVPEPVDIVGAREFQIDYTRTASHLCWAWSLMLGFALAFGAGAVVALKQKDEG
jgi:ABC-type multidrug transport system ATPase subunit/pSer/pThr/pTyr-binding forkhead associated (FHA) protein